MYDVIVIGSGPAGLGSALYLKRAEKNILIAEQEYEGGGQITQSVKVNNYLGIPAVTGENLSERFRRHVLDLGVLIKEGEVKDISLQKDQNHQTYWKIQFENGEIETANAIIYAPGTVHKRLCITGEEELSGRGVSHCAYCDGNFFKNKVAAVIGGGDTALDDALYLSGICKTVYLIHRRKEFRGSEGTVQELKKRNNIVFLLERSVEEIAGTKKVEKILLDTGEWIMADGVFVAIGSLPRTELIKEYVELDEKGYIKAVEDGITKTEGLFVAGDIRKKKLRQVITAVSDGANAAASAVDWLNKHGGKE